MPPHGMLLYHRHIVLFKYDHISAFYHHNITVMKPMLVIIKIARQLVIIVMCYSIIFLSSLVT